MKKKQLDNLGTDNYNKFKSESGHWYTQEGEPMYTIIGANGKERNTTLRDAKVFRISSVCYNHHGYYSQAIFRDLETKTIT